ncbi:hypothetical protein IWW43_000684 [Coemansia sp. RSA 1935]|nr:hypothetical protein IWW43_000684 [Coemansia sp. RSA 1935]
MTVTESCRKRPRLDIEEAETLPIDVSIAMPQGAGSSEHVDWTLARVHERIEPNIYSMRDYRSQYMIVDKTLLCKAFLETKHKVIRLCAPSGIGKTFNIDTLKHFFAAVSKYDMPYLANREFGHRIPLPEHLDSKVARTERMKLFHNTLLLEKAPKFFEEHFCHYQVVCLDLHPVVRDTRRQRAKSTDRAK